MKAFLSITFMVMCGSIAAYAQLPHYFWSNDTGRLATLAHGYEWRQGTSGKVQVIYYPSNFPTAPSGHIVNLYLKTGSRTLASQSIYYNFKVQMGYTVSDSFTNGPIVPDTFKTGLITVFDAASFVIPGTDTIGKWIKIPLNKSSFFYRGNGTPEARNIVIEFSFGPPKPTDGFLVRSTVNGHKRYLGGSPNDVFSNGVKNTLLDIGFDFGTPLSVEEPDNIESLDLFPNPARDGKFNIAFDTRKPVSKVRVTVTDVAGKQVFDSQYGNSGLGFFRAIDAGYLPEGMYFVRVEGDGEVLNRRMVIQ